MRNAKALAALFGAAFAVHSHAVVAFDNFGPGTAFNRYVGLPIRGSMAAISPKNIRQAAKFTSSASGTLDYIEYAAGLISGTDRLIVSLLNDNAGTLGSIIYSWNTTGYLTFGDDYGTKKVYASSVTLTAGTSYWVLLEPDENTFFGPGTGQDTRAAWNLSPSGYGDVAVSFDGGATYSYTQYQQGAFRVVLGEPAVPGPAAALPFALGLLAARRRRK